MKYFVLITAFVAMVNLGFAQTVDELLNQKKLYKKYGLLNIANNEVYLQLLKEGYGVYRDGSNTWHNIKTGELGMHTTYFNSLKAVSPIVANDQKINGCANFQAAIMKEYNKGKKEFPDAQYLSSKEKNYIIKIYQNLLDECSKSMDELNMVVTSNKVEMSDDERIKNIDRIYEGFKDKYSFILDFNNSTRILNISRQRESGQNSTLRSLYGTN